MSDHEREALHLQQQHLSLDDKPALNPEQRCDRCGTPLSPRWGSGGSRQRFCSSECRLDFHTRRQRMERRAAYIAPTTLPATGQPSQHETPTRDAAVAALHPWETGVLDIANCDRTEFVVGLEGRRSRRHADRKLAGLRFERLMDQHVRPLGRGKQRRRALCALRLWPRRNIDGIQSCVLILHHSRRG